MIHPGRHNRHGSVLVMLAAAVGAMVWLFRAPPVHRVSTTPIHRGGARRVAHRTARASGVAKRSRR